ncbi:MAG: phosphodiester glycosidase family protein [Candidatus Baltobacteraceae bacterium]
MALAFVVTDAVTMWDAAPGVQYGEYEMRTVDGPLSIHVLAIDPHEPSVRLQTALASDTLVSSGETLSSMIRRTGAVAGINADYFDINQTNEPLNLLVRDARLIRPPMQRPVLAVDGAGNVFIAEFALHEFAQFANANIPLAAMNDWPPRKDAAMLITPDYGALPAAPDVRVARLETLGDGPPLTTYRVRAIDAAGSPHARGAYLAFGPQFDARGLPALGETISVQARSQPPLEGIAAAAGGGPLLVKDGAWFADPHGPSSGEFATRMPASAAGITRNGTLLFVEVDGREPMHSIGVLQPQLGALLIALGASTAMQFDGGGSSTIAARLPGSPQPQLLNAPSDGQERRIADAFLVFSHAAGGAPVRIVTRPQTVRAVVGARVNVTAAEIDAADRTVSTFSIPFFARKAGTWSVPVERDGLRSNVTVQVAATPARIAIDPPDALALSGARVRLLARAFDAGGYGMALPQELDWKTDSGTIDARGNLAAGTHDATVRVRIGNAQARERVVVGEHEIDLPFAANAAFFTAPRNEPGGLDLQTPCDACLSLRYDFSGPERAAYAAAALPLRERAIGLSLDVLGDANGETLRAAVTNAMGERFLYTIARIDWSGWRREVLRFPAGLPQPIVLRSLYLVGRIGNAAPSHAAGALALRSVREILAGSPESIPK